MNRWCRAFVATALVLLSFPSFLSHALAQDPFAAHVRPTDPLSPDDEQKAFELPPGFSIELFASEPEIHKPLNMAFDDRGRLWVTDTIEYPYPAPKDREGRDTIKILEDTDDDGRADRVTTFATGLNVPIGIVPVPGGCVAWSIPNIWRFYDDDDDGVADRREKLYGPFGWERDTHGMNNAFRRGVDGWIYACHGFNNITRVKGADGHEISMQSGNTYRFRLDGSRIEQWTHGQVNPFGSAFDSLLQLYTADCHSRPIYQLLRGAYYPSFGKPHDGLGFGPEMMRHSHGSTAICGLAIYTDVHFPPEYRGNFFVGNVMTSRVNRDAVEHRGSSVVAIEKDDFVKTSDPWFRPVDNQIGPDGALYIADFYNRIIGHYEVALDHPGRDRFRGRIWRVTYRGDDPGVRPAKRPAPLDGAPLGDVVAALGHPSLVWSTLALEELCDRGGSEVAQAFERAARDTRDERTRGLALWGLLRVGSLDVAELDERLTAAAADPATFVRVQAMRIIAESSDWSATRRQIIERGLEDENAFVRRAAADAFGRHPASEHIRPLLDTLASTDAKDDHLVHTLRMALRDQLLDSNAWRALDEIVRDGKDRGAIARVALGVPSRAAGEWLVEYLEREGSAGDASALIEHAAAWVGPTRVDALAKIARRELDDDLDRQAVLLEAVRAGLERGGTDPREHLRDWATALADELLGSATSNPLDWTALPVPGMPPSDIPWAYERRQHGDPPRSVRLVSSFPRGEQLTGILRSRVFDIPPRLSFLVAGHDGFPGSPRREENRVRLHHAESGEILAEVFAPRNDVAQRIDWDLSSHTGSKGYLEIVDANTQGAYAWIAFGSIEPEVVSLPRIDPAAFAERVEKASAIAARFGLVGLAPKLASSVATPSLPAKTREATLRALASLAPDVRVASLLAAAADPTAPASFVADVLQLVDEKNQADLDEKLAAQAMSLPLAAQTALALSLSRDATGGEALLGLVESGRVSGSVLARPRIREALLATTIDDVESRIETLLADLPDEDEERQKLIDAKRAAYRSDQASAERGLEVFRKSCAACHRAGEEGNVVGPQLDGIGGRGLDRILEDLLAPNRNVDIAFRTQSAITKRGEVISGLLRSSEGAVLRWVDSRGEEFTIQKDDVESLIPSNLSLMPDNIADTLSAEELNDLLAFLLGLRAK